MRIATGGIFTVFDSSSVSIVNVTVAAEGTFHIATTFQKKETNIFES